MQADLSNKVSLVTGAGRGIGRAIATALVQAGSRVVAAARSTDELASLAAEAGPDRVMPHRCDVSDEASVMGLFEAIDERIGRLDVVVNNAGIGRYGPVAEFSAEQFDRVMAVNLRGTFLCCREAMRRMIPAGGGYVINISSVVGFKGYPNQAAYTASKHGVMGLTKSLAVEGAQHGVRVSAILPGGVDTEMVARARPDLDRSILILPEDIASTVLYLLGLSERAHVDQIYIRRASGTPF